MIEKIAFRNKPGQFDLLKGLMILLVIIDHVNIEWLPALAEAAEMKLSFTMGCFFFIYGYGFRKAAAGKCLKQQAGLLLKPYVIMMAVSVFIVACKSILKQQSIAEKVVPCILTYLLFPAAADPAKLPFELVGSGTQWFFLCSFWAALILNGILKVEKEKVQAVLAAAVGVAGVALRFLPVSYLQIPQALTAVPILYAGFCWNKYKLFGLRFPGWVYLLSAAVSAVYLCFFSKAVFCPNIWGHGLLDYIGTLFVTLTVLVLYMRFPAPEGKVTDLFRYAGRYSYWIICINGIDFSVITFSNILNRIFDRLSFGNGTRLPGIILQFAWSISLIVAGCSVIRRIQQKLMERKLMKNEK